MTRERDQVDEIAVVAAERRLDDLAAQHPELRGPSSAANVDAWIEALEHDERGHTPMAKEDTEQVAFRFPRALLARVDRHVERMNREHPGLGASRADAVRTLLTRALDEVERGDDRKRSGR